MHTLRIFLLPFSIIYGCVTFFRNYLFDIGIIKQKYLPVKSIGIGNLSLGGTGKTPHALKIASFFPELQVAYLSRGYGRKTKGFRIVKKDSSPEDVGDEPLMIKLRAGENFPVAVCENRFEGVKQLLQRYPNIDLILLDDIFQHRRIKVGYSILLTEYGRPYYTDFVFPAGNLREWKSSAKRADSVIITKCPDEINAYQKNKLVEKIGSHTKNIHFSRINYQNWIAVNKVVDTIENVLLVTGIAGPNYLKNHLTKYKNVVSMEYSDHHYFNPREIEQIHQKFDTFAPVNKVILTTEKDFVRLKQFIMADTNQHYPWYYIPIGIEIENESILYNELNEYVRKNK
jgi:tetraacyldisaccharide 4'-kinase